MGSCSGVMLGSSLACWDLGIALAAVCAAAGYGVSLASGVIAAESIRRAAVATVATWRGSDWTTRWPAPPATAALTGNDSDEMAKRAHEGVQATSKRARASSHPKAAERHAQLWETMRAEWRVGRAVRSRRCGLQEEVALLPMVAQRRLARGATGGDGLWRDGTMVYSVALGGAEARYVKVLDAETVSDAEAALTEATNMLTAARLGLGVEVLGVWSTTWGRLKLKVQEAPKKLDLTGNRRALVLCTRAGQGMSRVLFAPGVGAAIRATVARASTCMVLADLKLPNLVFEATQRRVALIDLDDEFAALFPRAGWSACAVLNCCALLAYSVHPVELNGPDGEVELRVKSAGHRVALRPTARMLGEALRGDWMCGVCLQLSAYTLPQLAAMAKAQDARARMANPLQYYMGLNGSLRLWRCYGSAACDWLRELASELMELYGVAGEQ